VGARLGALVAYGECLHEIVASEDAYVTRDLGVLRERVCDPLARVLEREQRSFFRRCGGLCCFVPRRLRDGTLAPWMAQVGYLAQAHTALLDEWTVVASWQARQGVTPDARKRYDGVSAAVIVSALAKKLPFLERTYRAALRHHDAEPSVEEVLAELRERHERVAQIIVDAEAAPALVHASSRVIAPTVHDAQPIQRLLDAPRQRLQKYATMLGQLHRLMPTTHAERGALGELCADVERMVARIDSPLAAFLDEQRGRFVFADEAARRHGGEAYMRLDEFRELYEAYRRHHRVDEPGYAFERGVYDEPFRQRGLRVETATRVDPEHGGEATCAWLVGVALRDDAERPMAQS